MNGNLRILKNMSIAGIGTMFSRLSGLIRDQVMAIVFGAASTIVPDAYYAAFKIPNSLRNLLAEGGMTAAFLPTFKEYLLKDPKEAHKISNIMFTYLSLILIVLTALGIYFAPAIMTITAGGFLQDKEKFDLAVTLLRILFPYLYFISISALATAILNAFYHFTIPAITPVLLNIAIIFGATFISKYTSQPIFGVAIGIILGGILQLAIQIPPLLKYKNFFKINFNFKHPALKKIFILLTPTLFTFSIYEITAIIEQQIASRISQGTISVLYFANRLYQLPLAVFAISLSSALLPSLSELTAENQKNEFKNQLEFSISIILTLAIPSSIYLFIMSSDIYEVLFQYGRFSKLDSSLCSQALKAYAPGLIFISMYRVLLQAFYSMKNTRIPAIVSFITLSVFSLSAYILTFHSPLRFLGLPASTSLSTFVSFACLLILLSQKIPGVSKIIYAKQNIKTILFALLFLSTLLIIKWLFSNSIISLIISTICTLAYLIYNIRRIYK